MYAINRQIDPDKPTPLVRQLGFREYEPVWRRMQDFTQERNARTPDEIWQVEHPPVFTLGLNGDRSHILDAGEIPVVPVDRGGQVTYHGPGQLIIYLLLDLKRRNLGVRKLVALMETSIIEVLDQYRIKAAANPGAPGVYVDGRKIAALGLRVKKRCTYHGLSLNVDMDLEPFRRINPCGYEDLSVIQLSELVKNCTLDSVSAQLLDRLRSNLSQTAAKTGDIWKSTESPAA